MAHVRRAPLFALGMIALLAGMAGGLVRIGWSIEAIPAALVSAHGPLMVSGFLGTVIGLERAAAFRSALWVCGPLATGLAGLGLIAGMAQGVAAALVTAGSAGLVVASAGVVRRQAGLATLTLLGGGVAWLAGNIAWLAGRPLAEVVVAWMLFLVLTIAGERLELARVLSPSPARQGAFVAAVGLTVAGGAAVVAWPERGGMLFGAGLLAVSGWLGASDLAWRTIRHAGLSRFTAVCLLSGYVWLAIGGGLACAWDGTGFGVRYDALLHAIFLGFAFTMIFGHAPIIFPAVLGMPVPFRNRFYLHLVLLHATLALRVAGDLCEAASLRQWGGLGNVMTLLLFVASTVAAVAEGRRPAAATGQPGH